MAIANKLTYQDAVRYAEELVAEFGDDYVYTRLDGRKAGEIPCVYAEIDEDNVFQPSCIVARIFAKHGMTGGELAALDGWGSVVSIYNYHDINPANGLAPELDERTLMFLNYLQRKQDAGHTWGESLVNAKAAANAVDKAAA